MTLLQLFLVLVLLVAAALVALWLYLRTRRALREQLRRSAISAARRLHFRLDRYKLSVLVLPSILSK